MKKTIITLLALAGMAGAADSTPIAITLPGNSDFTWIAGSNAAGIGTGSSAAIIENLAAAITADNIGNTDLTGWFGGTGQAYGQTSYNEIKITATNSFEFVSRPALSGEYVALGVSLEETASAITLTFSNDKKAGYSLWSYDATTSTATELIATTGLTTAGTVDVTYNTANVKPSTLFVVWTANPSTGTGSEGGNTLVTISDIALSYTAAPAAPAVPEPTSATLSLLALAGLAARRRRASR